jgi:hypothetical protein
MKLEWKYRTKGADLYDADKGVRMGCVHEGENGDCLAMYVLPSGAWKYLMSGLPFIKAKNLVEVTVRLS